MRQRLADAYRTQLEIAQAAVSTTAGKRTCSGSSDRGRGNRRRWRSPNVCATASVDSVVILDDDGNVAYPAAAAVDAASTEPRCRRGDRAEQLEFGEQQSGRGGRGVPSHRRRIDRCVDRGPRSTGASPGARSARAIRVGAIEVLAGLANERPRPRTRTVARWPPMLSCDCSNCLTRDSAEWKEVAASLAKRLNDYEAPLPPADQRRFLMHALRSFDPAIELQNARRPKIWRPSLSTNPIDAAPPGVMHPTKVAECVSDSFAIRARDRDSWKRRRSSATIERCLGRAAVSRRRDRGSARAGAVRGRSERSGGRVARSDAARLAARAGARRFRIVRRGGQRADGVLPLDRRRGRGDHRRARAVGGETCCASSRG